MFIERRRKFQLFTRRKSFIALLFNENKQSVRNGKMSMELLISY